MNMIDLTVIILTKDEENNIEKCIRSFMGIAKRFVIVDSFSKDRTKEICLGLGLDFYEHEFTDHASQFNWALKHTDITTQWTMRMDADEELTEELCEEIQTKINLLPPETNGIILKRRVYFMGKWIKHGGVYPQCLLRVFRTGTAVCEQKLMDEHIILLGGETVTFDKDMIDNNTKNLEWWTQKHNWYSNKEVSEFLQNKKQIQKNQDEVIPSLFKGQAERNRWLKYFIYYRIPLFTRPMVYFIYRYIFKLGFLDGKEGIVFHFLQGCWYRFLVDAKILELQKIQKSKVGSSAYGEQNSFGSL
ncbi:glycosyltransferase family 2 protein [Paenibacillus validus]|uniref:glycosyltransferase family 2 protein n=1 Tax=Paenibacillus validus TaxID=44253 RepID=UPI003D287460